MPRRPRPRERWVADRHPVGDAGTTLVELVLTVSIVGLICTALIGVVLGYFRTTLAASTRFTESHDVMITAAYWQQDVAGLGIRTFDAATKSFVLQRSVGVAPACTLPAGQEVVTLGWSDYQSLDSTAQPLRVTVTYLLRSSGSGYALQRVLCEEGAVLASVPVAASLAVAPTITCDTACDGTGDAVPTRVTLGLRISDVDGGSTQTYTADLVGERRQT